MLSPSRSVSSPLLSPLGKSVSCEGDRGIGVWVESTNSSPVSPIREGSPHDDKSVKRTAIKSNKTHNLSGN